MAEAAGHPAPGPALACVILAHTDPVQVRRLVAALDPFPVFLHCDVRTADATFEAMTADRPDRCVLMPRLRTGWARWENVVAEIEGYRQALETTDATHMAILSGTDYPILAGAEIEATLRRHPGASFAHISPIPRPEWNWDGGRARLRFHHVGWRKHMLRSPLPRRLPRGIRFAGGSQMKVLAREHARALVDALDNRPDLVKFWRWTWAADETFVPSIMSTPSFVPDWETAHLDADLWVIGWGGERAKSPKWLRSTDLELLQAMSVVPDTDLHRFFARKFGTAIDTAILDEIDARMRVSPTPA